MSRSGQQSRSALASCAPVCRQFAFCLFASSLCWQGPLSGARAMCCPVHGRSRWSREGLYRTPWRIVAVTLYLTLRLGGPELRIIRLIQCSIVMRLVWSGWRVWMPWVRVGGGKRVQSKQCFSIRLLLRISTLFDLSETHSADSMKTVVIGTSARSSPHISLEGSRAHGERPPSSDAFVS